MYKPEPLMLSEEDADVYVDLVEARGGSNPVEKLAREFRFSPEGQLCRLLTGHRGSGKSTELYQLKKRLAENEIFACVIPAENGIDYNDVDFPEVLLTIARELKRVLQSELDIDLGDGYFRARFDWLKNSLGAEVPLEGVMGMLGLSSIIKESPQARSAVRKAMEPDTSNLILETNKMIGDARKALKKKNYTDLVLLVDDLDKVNERRLETGKSLGENLFVTREPQMSGFACHVVYTVPIGLVYSSISGVLTTMYGGNIPVTPMVKIAGRPPTRKPIAEGIAAMRDVVRLRTEQAGSSLDRVFEDGVLDRLITNSGGQLRELMHFLRMSLIRGDVPVSMASAEEAMNELRRTYNRQLTVKHRKLLKDVVESVGNIDDLRTDANEQTLNELLQNRSLLHYSNDEEWYAPNPLVDG